MILRTIHIKSNLSQADFESCLKKGMNSEHEFFPRTILYGEIDNHKVTGIINPPAAWSDPFCNTIRGTISEVNEQAVVELTIRFGWVNWGALLFWYIPLFSILDHEKNQDLNSIVEIVAMLTAFSLLSGLLLYLKLRWDSNRLKKWMDTHCHKMVR